MNNYTHGGMKYVDPRKISTNMNSCRDVAMFMHTPATEGGPRTYVPCEHIDAFRPEWWKYTDNRINVQQPMLAGTEYLSPQPLSDEAYFAVQKDTGTYIYDPSFPEGKKWVWDVSLYSNPGPIGPYMTWSNQDDYSETQFAFPHTCCRYFLWRNVVVKGGMLYVGGKPIPLGIPSHTLRVSGGPKTHMDMSDPLYDPSTKTHLFPPCEITDAIKQDPCPEKSLAEDMLHTRFAPSWYKVLPGDVKPPAPHDRWFHSESFESVDYERISGRRLYEMLTYSKVHWSLGENGAPWNGGIPMKAFDLFLCVVFYEIEAWRPGPNGNDEFLWDDFGGAYGTAYVIY